ncbi:hypothetical protein A5906_00855 [Bradyrhizobium sacchari]|uniref:DUF4148 domain-containing protein n=1 Tax=Bradyrhizobium sacchari TaxID=1399419 RepID=A0A560K777_9BRAD|nr:hypothetical protein [Bradyrhizobium sacchari]OPY96892.1 hypothetical protein A5906_00855 [Bradyrhizobium sacchari]TWB55604.1 hypothetical protein FBZ94_107120 [Bradyrhizobium sacchari]TWB79087.1 hypothetical protein FBZ95_103939 [Bradyrhizobium sacchari]
MRNIVLSTLTLALIATSLSQAAAARSRHVRKATPAVTSEQFRNARDAIAPPSQSAWRYSGWSAPAGH